MDSNLLKSDDFGLKIYNRFPPAYREDDVKEKFALKRYLQVTGDGGFKYAIEDINGLTNIIDPKTTKNEALKYLAQWYGLDVFNGIPNEYLRFVIPMLADAWKKKGSVAVLETIVSVMSGVKTISEVHYDEHGLPYVDIKLEMDYNSGKYFPDPEHFNKLLDKFLPFYVDRTLIYDYMFYVTAGIHAKENYFDRVREKTEEQVSIPRQKGYLYLPMLNIDARRLNENLILNNSLYYSVDPDWFEDKVVFNYSERATFTREISDQYMTFQNGVLNSDKFRLNEDPMLNTGMLVDNFRDKIIFVPAKIHDVANVNTKEKYHDLLKIEDEYGYYSSINEIGMTLNDTFTLNEDKVDRKTVVAKDFAEDDLSDMKTDGGSVADTSDDLVDGLFTNAFFSTLNDSVFHVPDCFDVITNKGVKTTVYPTLKGVVGL